MLFRLRITVRTKNPAPISPYAADLGSSPKINPVLVVPESAPDKLAFNAICRGSIAAEAVIVPTRITIVDKMRDRIQMAMGTRILQGDFFGYRGHP